MDMQIGSVLIVLGMALVILAQLGIAIYAFSGNPIKGIFCAVVPFYVIVYAKKNKVGIWFMRIWCAGIAIFVVGGVMAS